MAAKEKFYSEFIHQCMLQRGWVHWFYEASIITDHSEHTCDMVKTIDITRDFINQFYDVTVVEVQMLKEYYIRYLYPNRDKFQLRLKRSQTPEFETGMRLTGRVQETFLYKGVLCNPIDLSNNSNENTLPTDNYDPNANNTMILVKIQIYPESIDQLMRMTFGGCWSGNPGDVLKGMLTEPRWHINTGNEEPVIRGVEMTPPDEKGKYEDIVIPHGTRLVELPKYLQLKGRGIYANGLGSYIHNANWYIYPLFDYQRFTKATSKLTIVIIPKIHMHNVRRTYRVHNREVIICAGGGVQQSDKTSGNVQQDGSALTYIDPNASKNDTTQWNGGGITVNPDASQREVSNPYQGGGYQSTPYHPEMMTQNTSAAKSEVAERNAWIQTFTWEYAHPMLLEPGMATQVHWYQGNVKYLAYGTLLHVGAVIQHEGRDAMRRHATTCTLVVALDRNMIRPTEVDQFPSKGVTQGLLSKAKSWF